MRLKNILITLIIFSILLISSYINAEENGLYRILIGEYNNPAIAEDVYVELLKNGFNSFKEFDKETKVYIGYIKNNKEALNIIDILESKKIKNITNPVIEIKQQLMQLEKFNVKNYQFSDNFELKDVFDDYNQYFYINPNWNIYSNNYLNLVFSKTNIESYKNSTLTVLINKEPIFSTFVTDEKLFREELIIDIPSSKLKSGLNEMTIKTYNRISDEPCEDVVNPANWIVLNKESFIHIEYSKNKDEVEINNFPYPYVEFEEIKPIKAALLLPDNYKISELTPLMSMVAILNKRAGFNDLGIGIYNINEENEYFNKNGIFIGNIDNLPREWVSYFTNEELKESNDNAIIKEIVAPYNDNKKLLIILCQDTEILLKAVNALSDDKLVSQMNSDTQIISKEFENLENNYIDKDYFTFESLGFERILIDGVFHQKSFVDIRVPENWSINEDAKLYINMRYSELIDFQRSGLTLYINGIPIGSKKLYLEKSKNDYIEIELPKEVLSNNYMQLTLDFYLQLPYPDCLFRQEGSAWVNILGDSYFYLPHKSEKELLLENYPYPLTKNYSFNNLLIILPDNPNINDIKSVGNIISFLGQRLNKFDNLEVITANEYNNDYENTMKLIIGTPNSNSLINKIKDELYIKFNELGNQFESNEKIKLLENYNKNLTSIQLVKTSQFKLKDAFIVTATNENALTKGAKYLSQSNLVENLRGDALVIDDNGIIHSDYFARNSNYKNEIQPSEKYNKEKIKKDINDNKVKYLMIFTIGMLIIIAVVAYIIMILKKRKR